MFLCYWNWIILSLLLILLCISIQYTTTQSLAICNFFFKFILDVGCLSMHLYKYVLPVCYMYFHSSDEVFYRRDFKSSDKIKQWFLNFIDFFSVLSENLIHTTFLLENFLLEALWFHVLAEIQPLFTVTALHPREREFR